METFYQPLLYEQYTLRGFSLTKTSVIHVHHGMRGLHLLLTTSYTHHMRGFYSRQASSVGSHSLEGTQRLEEPVSKMMVNSWGGVPMVMLP